MRLTLGDLKNSSIPEVLNVPACSAKFRNIANEAQQRLVQGAELFWGLWQRYAISICNGKITWPRRVASVLQFAYNDRPLAIRNQWFEFLEAGIGIRDPDCPCDLQVFDRGTACTFEDIDPNGDGDKKVRIRTSVAEASGLSFGVFGYKAVSGEWIRTFVNGSWVDGEWLTVPTTTDAVATSTNDFASITDIIKPVTNGDIRMYEYGTEERIIGLYENDETRPSYRRTLVGSGCGCAQVTAMVKLEFVPAVNDNDWLLVGSLPAMKEMMRAVQKRDQDALDEAANFEAAAFKLLDRELAHYTGPGYKAPVRMEGQVWGYGGMNMQ